MTAVRVRQVEPAQVPEALDLILAVFREHVASLYSPEGVAEFERYVSATLQLERLASGHALLVAETDLESPVGVAEIRKPGHPSMFFVRTDHQRRGVGRALLSAVIDHCRAPNRSTSQLTVHASPNSVDAYRHMGFVPLGPEREDSGIIFVPMALSIRTAGGG
jgi:GNAT superfamily N-acetyltransferase